MKATLSKTLYFQEKFTEEERLEEATKILKKYKDRIPIIVEKYIGSRDDIPIIDKNKFLVPSDITMGAFTYIIRKRIKLEPHQAIFLFVSNSTIPSSSSLLSEIYEQYKHTDQFLYLRYSGENTFGW